MNYNISEKITRIVLGEGDGSNYVENVARFSDNTLRSAKSEVINFQQNGENVLSLLDWSLTPRELFLLDASRSTFRLEKTIDGERAFVENETAVKYADSYSGRVRLQITGNENIYGLGQHERGVLNHRSDTEYLYQNNMKIPMPVFLSSKGYAVFFDTGSFAVYNESDNIITMDFDAVDRLVFYIIVDDSFDGLHKSLRVLTGGAAMLPRWAFGYVQSRERYKTQAEILETAQRFRKENIPLDCIILDWLSWEDGKWGNKRIDKTRFPNLAEMVDSLHQQGTAFMISVWPNINRKGEDNVEMLEQGKLLANLNTYNAFDEEGRTLFWKQCERDIFSAGTDGWWCDSTEPFTPDWSGAEKLPEEERYRLASGSTTKYIDARHANDYALAHAKGIYENQRKACDKKRVINLTRSGSPSIQKYGTILWSGDIFATWEVMRAQIAEGLSMSLSGVPFWTLDIGGFFTGSEQCWRRFSKTPEGGQVPWFWHGDFEDGVKDPAYRELYVRWLQLGTFLPVMRSHGTDTPREPWQFGQSGDKHYDTIVKYIRLRQRMMPYTYSLAHAACAEGRPILRQLFFDFPKDGTAAEIANQFMFGGALLCCPVTEPMEYAPYGNTLEVKQESMVYLPDCEGWFDFETGAFYSGGMTVEVEAPIEKMPVFVKAGAVLPLQDENGIVVHVYEGADGYFELYFDNGMDYAYERGEYAVLPLTWENNSKTLHRADVRGTYPIVEKLTAVLHTRDGLAKAINIS